MTANTAASLLPAEQQALLHKINQSQAPIPDQSLYELISMAGSPQDPAVLLGGQVLARDALLARAGAVAARLQQMGVAAGETVAGAFEPGMEHIVAVLAALRADVVYLPVSPTLGPVARGQLMVASGCAVVLTQSWLVERLGWPEKIQTLAVDEVTSGPPPEARPWRPDATIWRLPHPDGPAPFTSVTHRAMVTMVVELNRKTGLAAGDRMLGMAPPESALGIYEVFGALVAGVPLVIREDLAATDPAAWMQLLGNSDVTVWHSPPGLVALLAEHLEASGHRLPPRLRLMLIGGECLAADLLRRVWAAAEGPLTVFSLGGAGIAGLWATCAAITEVPPADWRTVPIGRPLPNQRIYVLSEAMSQCPVWVTGRVYFGGVIAESGLDGADAEQPIHPDSGEKLLRTKYFGRVLPDGAVEIMGDEDGQVTVNGRGLPLQDAEIALATIDPVRQAIYVPPVAGSPLRAFVRLRPGAEFDDARLLKELGRKVSPYLTPKIIELAPQFPLTADGRVDRVALAATVPAVVSEPEPIAGGAPDELMAKVIRLACRVLRVNTLEPNTDLRDVGATSMELVRLATAVEEEQGLSVDVEQFLTFPSIGVLVSRHLAESAPAAAPAAEPAVLTGLTARQAFKDRVPGIRHDLDEAVGIELIPASVPRPWSRRTHRRFSSRPVEFDAIAAQLSALRQITGGRDEPKRQYPSAGSLYPVGVYLAVSGGRVSGLADGSYYYHPVRNSLLAVGAGPGAGVAAHHEINRHSALESAFSIYLIARMAAITPLYGDLAADFALIEAGAIAQVLMQAAVEPGLGCCPVGSMDVDPLRQSLDLGPGDRFMHALLCGYPREEQ
ncbi:AMP-binding protein [Mycobacteroides abscessus]|uniref:AMP-binding protein n=2 Tax=Mycobacteroides abscessus TaxID=36809 RepID=UPI00025846A9|nr:AMP-binding protein [Mycobacteroides abscessus]EIC67551.1 AMP-dependent synthetase and ligase [Mycobacteroides abscessus M93]